MPIVKVDIVEATDRPRAADLARSLADAIATALGSEPQSVWVRLVRIAGADYAENGGSFEDVAPIFVTLLEKEPPRGGALAAEVAALTAAVASACGTPENAVHLIYEPPGRGRVAFGGRLVR